MKRPEAEKAAAAIMVGYHGGLRIQLNVVSRRHRLVEAPERYARADQQPPSQGDGIVFPDVCLETDAIVHVFPQEGKPDMNGVRVTISDLNESPACNPLKVFLRLLVDEGAPWDGPTLRDLWQRDWPIGGKVEIVG